MIKILIGSFFGIVAYAIAYSGRFKFPIKRDSLAETVYRRINLALHVVAAVIALLLPPLTRFTGAPVLAYLGGAVIIASLLLYRLMPLTLHARIVNAGGQRAKPLAEQERTRWPYAWTCGTGYIVMLAYIWTIAPIYW